MIQTRADLRFYLSEDAKQANEPVNPSLKIRIANKLLHNYNRQFMVCLRKAEYYHNNMQTGGVFTKLSYLYYSRKLADLRAKTGNGLYLNVVGPGLHLSHGKVVIGASAKIGEHCKILSDVTIGGQGRYDRGGVPTLGNRVFVGSGARIIGDIKITDDVVIGANSVVVKDILEANTTWAGNPARKISNEGSYHFLNRQ
ncbi:MAG: serine acetyltransferase [Prevotella sp.]|nr:serine acetyltransferase [Prevotella sp.]